MSHRNSVAVVTNLSVAGEASGIPAMRQSTRRPVVPPLMPVARTGLLGWVDALVLRVTDRRSGEAVCRCCPKARSSFLPW